MIKPNLIRLSRNTKMTNQDIKFEKYYKISEECKLRAIESSHDQAKSGVFIICGDKEMALRRTSSKFIWYDTGSAPPIGFDGSQSPGKVNVIGNLALKKSLCRDALKRCRDTDPRRCRVFKGQRRVIRCIVFCVVYSTVSH